MLAWCEWWNLREVAGVKTWRRAVSHAAVLFESVGLALWIYGFVHEVGFQDYSYTAPSAGLGRWLSLGLIVVSSFAEAKLRRFLLLGSVGILFFFSTSIGDVAI